MRTHHPGQQDKRGLLPSFSFSFSSFLLFLVDDFGCAVACPEPVATGAEEEAAAAEAPAEAARAASTLLPHRAQESSCSSTGDTPSSTRKLTWRRKYRTAAGRGERAQLGRDDKQTPTRGQEPSPHGHDCSIPPSSSSRRSAEGMRGDFIPSVEIPDKYHNHTETGSQPPPLRIRQFSRLHTCFPSVTTTLDVRYPTLSPHSIPNFVY